ncbi:neprilysin-2-like [Leptopilina heterotoma]|uniref:neprilysin-2-like n=1 Tax=Leptopilina heterotoma TaxID=63436 RepID=UPI001CAA1E5C|nr:neprilysin-2-like [Leptopilina heterotoma]
MKEEFINRCSRRRRLNLKCGLTMLCLAIFVTLSEGHFIPDNDFILLRNRDRNHRREILFTDSLETNNRNDDCFTPECIDTAIRVLMYMDKNVDPCDDFYKFACGQYPYFVEFPNSESNKLDEFSIIEDKVKKEMTSILEEEYTSTESRYAKLIKTFYQTCMKTTDINKENIKLISDLLNTIGGWPLLEKTSSSYKNFQWEKFGSKMKKVVFLKNSFIISTFRQDTMNNSNTVIQIEQPESFDTSSGYLNLVEATVKLFGADEVKIKDITQIVDIEKRLFNISVPYAERTDFRDRMTVKELIGNYSNILWKDYFNTFLKPFNTIKDDDIILINHANYFKHFNKLIKHFSKRDQANYLIWKVVEGFLNNYVGSIENKKEKSKMCYNHVYDLFGNSFGMLYIRKHFDAKSITSVTDEMESNIFEQFNKILGQTDWMDSKTKGKAFEKLRSMSIVHPSIFESYTDDEIDEYFANLEITPGDFLQSFIKITKFEKYHNKHEFRKPVNFSSWRSQLNPITVNAMNYMFNNSLILSPAILQGIFVNENRPRYMNYGSMGIIIGHEYTHTFDNNGKNYDKFGNLVNWWEPESDKEFFSKTKCIIHQYGNYTVKEVNQNVNGESTQGENIADNGGVKLAYLAYEEYMKTHDPDLLLPGVDLSQRQLFWISFAQTYCVKTTEKGLNNTILNDFHSPNEFRVIGSIVNRPEFSRDFQCAKGTNMNPKNKCSVW